MLYCNNTKYPQSIVRQISDKLLKQRTKDYNNYKLVSIKRSLNARHSNFVSVVYNHEWLKGTGMYRITIRIPITEINDLLNLHK